MKIARYQVNNALCGDCSLALKRFIQGIDGVDTVDLSSLAIAIRFDESAIEEGKLQPIARNSIERLRLPDRRIMLVRSFGFTLQTLQTLERRTCSSHRSPSFSVYESDTAGWYENKNTGFSGASLQNLFKC
jgi:hypothetical protein